jgi:hypothetical protein
MGGKSSSSSSTSSTTVTQDNRVAAADSGVAVGQDGYYDGSTGDVNVTNVETAEGLTDAAESIVGSGIIGVQSLIDGLNAGGKQTQDTLREVFGETIDFAGDVSADSFEFLGGITGEQYELVDGVLTEAFAGIDRSQDQGYDFSSRVLEGYEESRLESSERKFNQIVTAGVIVAVVGLIAWAVVRGK